MFFNKVKSFFIIMIIDALLVSCTGEPKKDNQAGESNYYNSLHKQIEAENNEIQKLKKKYDDLSGPDDPSQKSNPLYPACNKAHGDCLLKCAKLNNYDRCFDECFDNFNECMAGRTLRDSPKSETIFKKERAAQASPLSGININQIRQFATEGDVKAQSGLGVMYLKGLGVRKDEREASIWLQKAAEQGDAIAQTSLGTMYLNGLGVPKDEREAAKWLQKAAIQNDMNAQSLFGTMYLQGRGVQRNDKMGVLWLMKAAEQGEPNAQAMLGGIYFDARNFQQSLYWFEKAAAQGNLFALDQLNNNQALRVFKFLTSGKAIQGGRQ